MRSNLAEKIDDLDRQLDEPEWGRRAGAIEQAARLLCACDEQAPLHVLLGLVERAACDEKWEVRKAAALAAGRVRDARAEALIERFRTDPNRWVREAARAAQRAPDASGAARPDPTLDRILSVIDDVRLKRLSRDDLLQLARLFGDLHYEDLAHETAHELRTVVEAVEGYLVALDGRLLDLGREDATLCTITAKLRERGRFLTRLVADLCEYTATPRAPTTTIRLERLIEIALDLVRARLGAARVSPHVIVSADLPAHVTIEGAADRLARALANVVANGIEALAEGGRVEISATTGEDDFVSIQVTDTGCGMDDRQVEQARHRYATSKRDRGGTGLGLPIVIRIIEREHGGRLRIESALGRGTTVRIDLPARQPPRTTP